MEPTASDDAKSATLRHTMSEVAQKGDTSGGDELVRERSGTLMRTKSTGDISTSFREAAAHLSDEQIKAWFDALDTDGDGHVTMDEFISANHANTGLGPSEVDCTPHHRVLRCCAALLCLSLTVPGFCVRCGGVVIGEATFQSRRL